MIQVDWLAYFQWYHENTHGLWIFDDQKPVTEIPLSADEYNKTLSQMGEPYVKIAQDIHRAYLPKRFVTEVSAK